MFTRFWCCWLVHTLSALKFVTMEFECMFCLIMMQVHRWNPHCSHTPLWSHSYKHALPSNGAGAGGPFHRPLAHQMFKMVFFCATPSKQYECVLRACSALNAAGAGGPLHWLHTRHTLIMVLCARSVIGVGASRSLDQPRAHPQRGHWDTPLANVLKSNS